MQNINDIIDQLMKLYFSTESTTERYEILHKVSEATQYMKQISVNEIENQEAFNNNTLVTPNSLEEHYIGKLSTVVSQECGQTIYLVRSTTLSEIAKLDNIDSLDMVDIVMQFESILDVEISLDESDTTIGEILDRI